jgi:hypothetical protein
MKKHSLYALVTAAVLAGGMSVTSASAADLGGNCCADLEERIAELEATTARKGNRKVSLTVSGWVNQQVTFKAERLRPRPRHHARKPRQVHGLGSDHPRLVGWLRSSDRSHGFGWFDALAK